jgi:3-isopropylmalate/(R)-2-methylmalate dehydratase small subunit
VKLSEQEVTTLLDRAKSPGYELHVSLLDKTVRDDRGFLSRFEIDDFRRTCLLEGLDEIGLTLKHDAEIALYEKRALDRGW